MIFEISPPFFSYYASHIKVGVDVVCFLLKKFHTISFIQVHLLNKKVPISSGLLGKHLVIYMLYKVGWQHAI